MSPLISHRPWRVSASAVALNTHNSIRDIVENIKVKSNPNKKFISLSIGDPTVFGNLQPPQELLKAVHDSLELNNSRSYGPVVGEMLARQAVANYCAHQGQVSAEDVILCSGCAHALDLAITVLAEPGRNILVPRPGFMIYKTIAEGIGIDIKHYNLLPDDQWKIDLEHLEQQIDDKTAAIIVINPSNPCGSVYSKKHLCDILDIASRNRVPIISDEIYEYFVFSGREFISIATLSKDVPVLVCSGLSKRFLVPGWRMGWLVIHDRHNIFGKEIRKGLFNLCGRFLGANKLIQQALPAILTSVPQYYFSDMMMFIEKQAKLAYNALQRTPGLRPIMPQGAMYMMVEIKMSMFSNIDNDVEFVERLFSEQSLMCIPGKCFYYPNFMRIVLTVPEDILQEACTRMKAFCLKHATMPSIFVEEIDKEIKTGPEEVSFITRRAPNCIDSNRVLLLS